MNVRRRNYVFSQLGNFVESYFADNIQVGVLYDLRTEEIYGGQHEAMSEPSLMFSEKNIIFFSLSSV